MVPGSLETTVSKPGSNHCFFEAVFWQSQQQQAQLPRSINFLSPLSDPLWENRKKKRMTSRENSWPTSCTNMHLTSLPWESSGKRFGKTQELPTCGVEPQHPARARSRKDLTLCQQPPALQSCFIPNRFVRSHSHQLRVVIVQGSCHRISVFGSIFTPQETSTRLQHSDLWLALNYIGRQEPVNEGLFRGPGQKPQTQQPRSWKPWPQGNLHTTLRPDAYFKGFQVWKHGLPFQMKNWTSKSI